MKIQSSEVLLSGQHQAVQKHSKSASLKAWVGNQRPDFEGRAGRGQLPVRDSVALSQLAQSAMQTAGKDKTAKSEAVDPEKALENDPRAMLIRLMVEALTGKKINLTSLTATQTDGEAAPAATASQAQNQAPPAPSAGYGVEYDAHESYSEAESMNFSAQGVVQTADGRQIDFTLQLAMERVYSREENVSVRLGDAVRKQKDPLVINFGGTAAQLTNTKFSFDIDSDGKADQVSFVGPNSGFIALDKNNDGKINNGSELFGAKSGDGFKDLAAYDQDKNGWIDENDPVFEQLKVWTKDAQGKDSLVGLKLKGIGALYLGKTATPFELKNGSNDSLGTIRSGGVYLNENGSVGTLQQVDLTV